MKSIIQKSYENYHKKILEISKKSLSDLELVAIVSASHKTYQPRFKNQKQANIKQINIRSILRLIRDIIFILLSIPGLVKLFFSSNLSIIWSSDFYDNATKGDFRLGNLYHHANNKNLSFLEFISTSNSGIAVSLKNFFKRKRPIVFFDAFARVIIFFTEFKVDLKNFKNFNLDHQEIIYQNILNIRATKLFLETICNPKKIKNVFIWEISAKTSGIFYWAKLNNIKTIGIMHGISIKEYMYYETMPGLKFNNHLRVDYFGVWSKFWLDYYSLNSNLYANYEISGPLREKKANKQTSGHKIILLVEPLLDPNEITKYSEFMNNNFKNIVLKVRSDFKKEHLQRYYDAIPILTSCKIEGGNIDNLLISNKFGFFIATHSTAIQDCLHFGLYPIILNTKTWGNYLNLDKKFICNNSSDMDNCLTQKNIDKDEINILSKKLADTGDGSLWVINKLKENY